MKKDLLIKLVKQKIEKEIKEPSSRIRVSYSDFKDHLGLPIFSESSPELVDILAEIEEESEGLFKLTDPLGVETNKDNIFTNEHYYEIVYDPKNIKHTNPKLLTLSLKEGLCRVIDGKTRCYKVSKDRYKILNSLENEFTTTKDLARRISAEEETIMTQIAEIRKQINKKLQLEGKEVIENNRGLGYRFGKHFKISKKY